MAIPEKILKKVEKPARYTGGEWGQTIKDKKDIDIRFAFCFPDTYEIGMSNLGIRILYDVLNARADTWCERVYAPWTDMEKYMREYDIPLFALESGDPLREFDFIGFTLQYELCYTNMLNMLSLSGVPIRSADRDESMPIVVCGGPCTYNAEPMADFIDLCLIGEGEEEIDELMTIYAKHKKNGFVKEDFLHECAKQEGFYVPSFYSVEYNDDGTVKKYTPKYDDIPTKIKKRIIKDMDTVRFPKKVVMPFIDTVHDRIMLEVYRGCIRGCRFCQAGMIYRPVREKSVETLCREGKTLADCTGYDDISLISLSISDYSHINELTDRLLEWTNERKISLSLPSLRADSFTKELMDKVSSVRAGGLTFAPEAGTQRLRDVINKNLAKEDLLRACRVAFSGGKSQVKLYFMQGLPTETDADLDGIYEVAESVIDTYYQTPDRPRKAPLVTISAACFIPKPFTAFQWEPQIPIEEYERRVKLLREAMNTKSVTYNWHPSPTSFMEAVISCGDRRLSKVIESAWRKGETLSAWEDYFDLNRWMEAFEECGLDPHFYANRRRSEDEILPWSMISCGVAPGYLKREHALSYEGVTTPDCRTHCNACGANCLVGGKCDV